MEQSNKKVITDEEVIKMLYQSKALENYNKSGIRLYHGKISEIIVEKNSDIFNINYAFKKFNNMNLYFKGEIVFSENEINQIKTEIEPYKDSIIAVCDFDSKRKYSEEYPRLKIIIGADALYASKTIMDICKENGWKYITI